MWRIIAALLILGLCGFYFCQNEQRGEIAPAPPRTIHESALKDLKQILPSVIFEKDILPVIEQNRKTGLTPKEIELLLNKLDTIGRALGGNVSLAVEKAAASIAPDRFPKKTAANYAEDMASSLAHAAKEGVKASMPALKSIAYDLLRALTAGISFLLDQAADLLQGH